MMAGTTLHSKKRLHVSHTTRSGHMQGYTSFLAWLSLILEIYSHILLLFLTGDSNDDNDDSDDNPTLLGEGV